MKSFTQHDYKFLIFFITLIFCCSLKAEMYKWVDENGDTHYSEKPPSSNVDIEVIARPPTVDIKSAQKELSDISSKADKARKERIEKAKEKEKAIEEEKEKIAQCEKAKKIQASYERPRVNYVNEDGSRRRGTEEERLKDLAKAKENVKRLCVF